MKLMADIGLEAYRFSISWSRLLPSMVVHELMRTHPSILYESFISILVYVSGGRGPVNPKGLQYYNNLINELITHG